MIEESPDRQPIPPAPGKPCGDLSLDPGGVASIVVAGVPCWKGRRVAERFARGRTGGYRCADARARAPS